MKTFASTATVAVALTLLEQACAQAHGNTDTGATMGSERTATAAEYHVVVGGYPAGPKGWPYADRAILDWKDQAPIVLWAFFGMAVVFPLIYSMIRCMALSALKSQTSGGTAAKSRHSDGNTTMTGYKDSAYGTFCNFLVSMVYVFMLFWYLTILIDTYWQCELTGPDNLCFYGSRPIFGGGPLGKVANNETFFAWWFVALMWNLVNFFVGKYIRNFFRTECVFDEATHIYVQVKNKKNVMVNTNKIVEISRKIAKVVVGEDDFTFHRVTVPVFPSGSKKSIDVLCRRYTFNTSSKNFEPAEQKLPSGYSSLSSMKGLSRSEAAERLSVLGQNSIPYQVTPWVTLIQDELNSYLYLYQFTIYSMWLWFSALTWGSPQVVVVLGAAAISITLTRYNQNIIKEITEYSSTCEVFRDGQWIEIDADLIVPGDKLKLSKRNWKLPCDLVMVKGTCITDESGLTGESMPVRKVELPANEGIYDAEKDTKHTLFAGTTVLQAGAGEGDQNTHAIVTETGIRTVKGELISHILFPADMVFQYDEELRVVFMLLMIYAFVLFGVSVWLQIKIAPLTWVPIFAFALFTISQILPPLLPIALVVGHTMSAKRLKGKKVLCVNPKRIAISGKIHVFCFDKTGTLTKQGLDFLGVRTGGKASFDKGTKDASSVSGEPMGIALATCHAVTTMGGGGGKTVGYGDTEKALTGSAGSGKQLVGNQVEVKMFEASGYELMESSGSTPKVRSPSGKVLTIEKRFEFDHHTMTMSVLVRDESGEVHVFCKGAPEKIGDLCDKASIAEDYDSIHQGHAMLGCYVIAVSTRSLGNIPPEDVAKMPRSNVEESGKLNMLGLLLFRNELKSDTADAIDTLHQGDIRSVMVTGDNAQCGLYIAKEARLLKPQDVIWLGEPSSNNAVSWTKMGESGYNQAKLSTTEVLRECEKGSQLAITGKALPILAASPVMDDLLLNTRIFARVKPDQKVEVVQMHIDKGLITGMCGDGGNDCGALRAAHAGIALSDAEASVVSPFTSATKSVQSVVDLVKEGRCALATSFAAYRFYITYGLNWSVVKTINFVYGVRMPITGYLTIDSISSWLVAWAITLALPLPNLLPFRPTTSLFAPQVMLSVLAPWAMWMIVMGGALIMQQNHKDHVDFPAHLSKGCGYWQLGDNWEATVFTTFMVFPLIWSGIVFSLGSKFRQTVFKNPFIWIVWIVIFLIYSCLLLIDVNDSTAVFHVASNAFNGRNAQSPIWMRFQFPQGCYDVNGTATAALTRVRGAGVGVADASGYVGWEPNNCPAIDLQASAAKCGPACAKQDPPYGDATPGMNYELRSTLYGMVVACMAAMLIWENVLNHIYVKQDPPIQETGKMNKLTPKNSKV